ncbi:DUF1592 domain-containing protein [Alienimonas chondri]|uniref:DUF1592 domain-containing protein n=1 Tax=Alienimonas chondri TaxID=2681879 RepID=A0ABX1VBG1_9PLAN|nr:DUF1592 domain-containing protein [Alienimonas chondri]NNJ25113.1 hypothetical protein [Alienimonas chondri]
MIASHKSPLLLKIALLAACLTTPVPAGADEETDALRPLLHAYCVRCHGPETQKSDVRLDRLAELDGWDYELIYDQIAGEQMPPAGEPRPSDAERRTLMEHTLRLANRDATDSTPGLRRLNKREYTNTIRDLLGLHAGVYDPGASIYEEEIDEGFDTAAQSLVISNELLLEYLDASEKSLRHALFISEAAQPESRRIEVNVGRMRGVGGSRYVTGGRGSRTLRLGGKGRIYDGSGNRTIRVPGVYRITATAAGVDRDAYSIEFLPPDKPFVLGFGVAPDDPASVSGGGRLLKTFDLQDDAKRTVQFDVWIDKDHIPYFSFVNGPGKPITQIRAGIRRGTVPKSAMKPPYRFPGVRLTEFTIEGPFYDQWPPVSLQTTYDSEEIPDLSVADERRAAVQRFAARTFRRDVTSEELRPYFAYLNRRRAAGDDWREAVIKTFAAMTASLDFLYLDLPSGPLDDMALANRLSYFLWSTMPDAELFAAARAGTLRDPAVLRAQIERMLADDRHARFCDSFVDQWLSLDTLGEMPPDAKDPVYRVYYRQRLEPAMREETRRYFRHVFDENRSVREFLDSDYSFINRGLAELYDVPFPGAGNDPDDKGFVRATFPPGVPRGGLLGHASVLSLTSNGVETSPVTRGVWALGDLLGNHPPPPPEEVPAITPDLNGALTVRDLLERHRNDAACMECHRQIDPLGFALESYDPIGRFRTRYSKTQAVSTNGTYLGRDFEDVAGLKRILLERTRPFARNLTVRIAEYAKGRTLTAGDFATVEAIVDDAERNDYRLRDLVTAIAVSDLMTNR